MNGSYRGTYSLVERIAVEGGKIDPSTSSRATTLRPKAITGGYVLEWDFRKGADYNVNLGSDSGYVGVKEPENDLDREGDNTGDGINSQQKSYISNYLNTVDNSLRSRSGLGHVHRPGLRRRLLHRDEVHEAGRRQHVG